jgi:hypothetical protein
VKCISADRAGNYNPDKFEQLFTEFDENSDNFLTKAEMSAFIKKVFKKEAFPAPFADSLESQKLTLLKAH